ncbi:hypothetical protein SNK05_012198 [Fusarium graminearum]|uniref:Chromosome 3, complete genome n=1 Tax=Gibberella zeae (strain ATCC MYA-4620 / CBS 123657 / FGSC 9075 / NRRL 31084 / PH-1) TaxID=229533 RepID=A0A098E2B4_GIBZE|nr:unnamed protein product [Fusarium graminearum]
MSSWETTALRLHSNVTVDSTPNSSHKSLPPVPKQKTKARAVTGVKEVSGEEESTKTKGWKPLSLSTPILLAVIALTILLAVAVETLAQRSASQGGLALSPSLKEMPQYARFSYLYVPTIIAVLYSMIWSWIDLDVKRMQPWFEMSKNDGATAENSVFLDYQYDFVAMVPFKSAKRKHWPVFFGGTAMIIVLWALTPLQSALLGTGIVKQTNEIGITNRSQLLPVKEHVTVLDPSFLNTGYAIAWLGQQFPPFTTADYALLPFYPDTSSELTNNISSTIALSNITAETTKLWTELDCWPAGIARYGPRAMEEFNFFNGQGCNTTAGFGKMDERRMYYLGFFTSPYSNYQIANPFCPRTPDSIHQFLAVWAKPIPVDWDPSPSFNISAVFCQPHYFKQKVLATVKADTFEPDTASIKELGPKETLTEKEFNTTAFEFLLGNGMAQTPITKDFPFNAVVEQHPRLNQSGFQFPVSNMVGFALAGRDLHADEYVHHDNLHKAYNHAHKYLFSVAVTTLLMNTTDFSNNTVFVDHFMTGVIVSRTFAIAVECFLLVVAIFTALILWFVRSAPSNLPLNPSSIRRYIDLFGNSPEVLGAFKPVDYTDEEGLLEEFKMDGFQMISKDDGKSAEVLLHTRIKASESYDKSIQRGYYDPVKPLALKRWIGLIFITALIGSMAYLSYLKQQETLLNGLIRPSENFEVLQLLENYIPTAFATLIEPFWVLLNRLLCVLQPFKDLWEGKAKPKNTIEATYTSIPPQLVFWRALKSNHFVLVLVCSMALLANLLAVGLGSLFNEDITTANYTISMAPSFAPRFDNDSVVDLTFYLNKDLITTSLYQDHFYMAMANLTSGTILAPWMSQEYYFQGYQLEDQSINRTGDAYTVSTRGFGAVPNCTVIPAHTLTTKYKEPEFWPTEKKNLSQCETDNQFIAAAVPVIQQSGYNESTGVAALEYSMTMDKTFSIAPCARTLPLGWARSKEAAFTNSTIEASFMICRPIFQTAMFNVTVDSLGNVISYNRTSNLTTTLDYTHSEQHTDILLQTYNYRWNQEPSWHNDTLSTNWMNYFIAVINGNRLALDPDAPVPDPEQLIPAVTDIYRRAFAILLGLNAHIFEDSDKGETVSAIRHTKETRIFMEDASFIITMTVLALNTVVACLFYIRAVAFVLPRMPTTIGAVVSYFAPSRLATPTYRDAPGQSSRTLSFGRYIGMDGKVHIGIEADPHVVPIGPTSLGGQKDLFRFLRRRRKDGNELSNTETWL